MAYHSSRVGAQRNFDVDIPEFLRRGVYRQPVKVLFLLISLGASFGFIAVVAMIAHASWFRLPSAVEEHEYVSFVRRTVEGFEQMSRSDFQKLAELVPEIDWFYVSPAKVEMSTPFGSSVIDVHSVSRSFFDVLGVDPAIGVLRATVDGPAVVLSYSLWHERYGSRTDAVGDQLHVRGRLPIPIIGVAPQGFGGIVAARSADAWILGTSPGVDARDEMYMRYPGANVFAAVPASVGFADPAAALDGLLSAFRFDTQGVEMGTRKE